MTFKVTVIYAVNAQEHNIEFKYSDEVKCIYLGN